MAASKSQARLVLGWWSAGGEQMPQSASWRVTKRCVKFALRLQRSSLPAWRLPNTGSGSMHQGS